jgi:phage/plasmid-associated DNA primase
LGVPQEMHAARQEWREHDDPLADFLEDCCEIERENWVPSARLSSAYLWWCKREHEKWPLGRDAFLDRIHLKGFESSRSRRNSNNKQFRSIEGLQLKDEVESALSAAENSGGYQGRMD